MGPQIIFIYIKTKTAEEKRDGQNSEGTNHLRENGQIVIFRIKWMKMFILRFKINLKFWKTFCFKIKFDCNIWMNLIVVMISIILVGPPHFKLSF